tara:strand:+ start:1819 stop:2718 length:900 start_codon:yes stop_codon:yes gene_type:complete
MFEMNEKDEKIKNPINKKLAKQFLFQKVGEFDVEDSSNEAKTTYYEIKLVPFKQDIKITEKEAIKWCQMRREPSKDRACSAFILSKKDGVNTYIRNSDISTKFEYFSNESRSHLDRVVKNELEYIIDRNDAFSLFAIESGQFDKHLENKELVRRYWRKPRVAYGPSFSVPFKFRSEVNDEPLRIDPSFQLGGFIGVKWRIHKYSPVYILPLATLGVTNISINESTVKSDVDIPDGQILARTLSLGIVTQIDNFQIGVVLGWDKPGGDIGNDWVYSDRPWYSFQIGFDFLNLNSGEKDKE